MQAKRDETTVNRDEMQVKGKQQPVANVRGVGDAAPYNGGHLCACTVGRGALTPPHLAGAARPSRKPNNAPRRHGGMPPYNGDEPYACTVGRGALTPPHLAGPTDYPKTRAAPTAA